MEVVGYLNHADLLLEDENGVAVIGGGHYVLSLGDHVYFKHALDHEPTRILVQISYKFLLQALHIKIYMRRKFR